MYQLIMFDWDGTLMDSAQKIANCLHASAAEVGLPSVSDQKAKSIIGLGLDDAMNALWPNTPAHTVNELVAAYKHHFVNVDTTSQELFSGVVDGLDRLNEAGAFVAVATGKSRVGLQRVLDEYDFHGHFVVTKCADETRSKPHPQMIHEILDFTSIDPKNSIMIGDTTFDMQMAGSANVHGLGVSYGVHSENDIRQAGAIDVVNSFNNVVDWLFDKGVSAAHSE
jgi:phosphoglycolate phosphatase